MANNYNPYMNNFYMQDLQAMKDRIDRTMQNYQQNQNQFMQSQQPQIQQTFQLSNPNNTQTDFDGKYAENIEQVKNMLVLKNCLFVSKDMSNLWFKDVSGNIKAYSLIEIVQKDNKDIEIDNLKKELNDMKILIAQQNNILNQNNIQQNVSENNSEILGKIEPVKKVVKKEK